MTARQGAHRQFRNVLAARVQKLDDITWRLQDMLSLSKNLRLQTLKHLGPLRLCEKEIEALLLSYREMTHGKEFSQGLETECIALVTRYNMLIKAELVPEDAVIPRVLEVRFTQYAKCRF